MMGKTMLTLEEFRKQEVRQLPMATGELSNLFRDIALAAKRINAQVARAGLVDILGAAGHHNVQGEKVEKLDAYANQQLITALEGGVSCAGVASEEMDDFISFQDPLCRQSKYVCVFDPLDGSSNIDVNLAIGTIFGIYRRISDKGTVCKREDFLQPGSALIAAGYILYGSSTMLVFATRRGVNGFTLDPSLGEFTLFMYPAIPRYPKGKLRLVYECNPFAFIMEIAGGKATNGYQRILDIVPITLHQRVPFIGGSESMVDSFETTAKDE